MYLHRFGLKRRPFPATPDSALYYPSTPHEAALGPLVRALGEDEGLLLLTGDPGSGKTLIGQVLLQRLGDNEITAFLPNSHLPDRLSLLQAILFDIGVPYEGAAEQVLRLRLTEHALKNCVDGKRTIVIIDEAHHLDPDLLEELRLLGNLEAGPDKAFQAVCLAQSSILETLKQPALAAWKQRLAVHAHLEPLGVEEACDYLLHHLRLAGGKPDKIIDEAALEALARGTRGIPRLLGQAAQQALTLADAAEMETVDTEAALEALAMLGLETEAGGDDVMEPHGLTHSNAEENEKTTSFRVAKAIRKTA